MHQTIKQVTEQIPNLQYNTAVAAMMEYLNTLRAGNRVAERAAVVPLVTLVAPFAPHLAEELHERLGGTGSIFETGAWPTIDPLKAVADEVEFVVQVNGKVRSRMAMRRCSSS